MSENSESNTFMSSLPKALRPVLEEVLKNQKNAADANAEAEKLEVENAQLRVEIASKIMHGHPKREKILKLLTP